MSAPDRDSGAAASGAVDPGPVHFMGIAGAGMSGLAELYVRRGERVTGCDANPAATDDLERLGIQVSPGHDPAHVQGAREVIVTSAVARDHPELQRARELGIPVTRRAEALGRAVSGGAVVAIAGTHGKTTTTVLTTDALTAAGLAPTGVAGGRVASWNGNISGGSDRLFVVEADEYDRSFHALVPTVAVVTSVEADHLDIYQGGLEEIREAFRLFLRPARSIALCADDAGAASIALPATAQVIRYGIDSPDARLRAADVSFGSGGARFRVLYDETPLGEIQLRVPGLHNVRNSLAAIASGLALGVTLEVMRPGIEGFAGVERRFQLVRDSGGVTIVDDYAHHPTEIAATLEAAAGAFPGRRIVAAFQPHLYTRTRDFHADFAAVLAQADAVFLCDIYAAREKPIEGVTSQLIADAMTLRGRAPAWRGPRSELAQALAAAARPGDVVLTLGAGDITITGRELSSMLGGVA